MPSFRRLPSGEVELHDARRRRRWSVAVESFEIATIPVTEEQYLGVGVTGSRRPVVSVSWLDAIAYCNALSERAGIAPAYDVAGGDVIWKVTSPGFRLPTEAEWEYACRAGSSGPHYGPLDEIAWTSRDHVEEPQAAGEKVANDFGLHDMLGNVWEWCWDYLDPARYGNYRVFRGGGFADGPDSARASTRRGGAPTMSHPDLGFRLVRGAMISADVIQGWSAATDDERRNIAGPLPSGWTPLFR